MAHKNIKERFEMREQCFPHFWRQIVEEEGWGGVSIKDPFLTRNNQVLFKKTLINWKTESHWKLFTNLLHCGSALISNCTNSAAVIIITTASRKKDSLWNDVAQKLSASSFFHRSQTSINVIYPIWKHLVKKCPSHFVPSAVVFLFHFASLLQFPDHKSIASN